MGTNRICSVSCVRGNLNTKRDNMGDQRYSEERPNEGIASHQQRAKKRLRREASLPTSARAGCAQHQSCEKGALCSAFSCNSASIYDFQVENPDQVLQLSLFSEEKLLSQLNQPNFQYNKFFYMNAIFDSCICLFIYSTSTFQYLIS